MTARSDPVRLEQERGQCGFPFRQSRPKFLAGSAARTIHLQMIPSGSWRLCAVDHIWILDRSIPCAARARRLPAEAHRAAEQVATRCTYSERSQSSSDLLCCQDGNAADGESPATFSSARRFISRFARA